MAKEKLYRTWKQANGIEIDEVVFIDAHAYKITFRGKHVTTIYAKTPEEIDDITTHLNAGGDIRDLETSDGIDVGTLLFYATSPYSMGDE